MIELGLKKMTKKFLLQLLYKLQHEVDSKAKVIEALKIVIDYL